MSTTFARWGACIGTLLAASGACNVFTGADDYVIGDDDDASSSSNGAGVGGSGTGAGSGGGISTSGLLPTDAAELTGIEIYQGVRRPLMLNGASVSSNVPVVAERDALMRIYYSASTAATVTVAVTIGTREAIVTSASISGTSTTAALGSTINVDIPADMLVAGAGYSVELLQSPELTSGTNTSAVYPAQGQEPLGVASGGGPLKIVLVPIAYGADGSNRVPPTQEGNYRAKFMSLFPASEVEVRVAPTFQWNSTVSANGSGWGNLLDAIVDYRQSSGAAFNEHYYGIFEPASSFNSYCSGGCVAGLSMLADSPGDEWARAGIGMGYLGTDSTETGAHEVGHQFGREHAPCDVNDADPGYPHSGGDIGEWGYDTALGQLIDPSTADFMGYCNPTWVSDYTFSALFSRLASVNAGAKWTFDPSQLDRTYERVRVDADGTSWATPITLHTPPMGRQTTVTVTGPGGPREVTGWLYSYSHMPGGVVLFPQQSDGVMGAAFDVGGLRRNVQRPQAVAD